MIRRAFIPVTNKLYMRYPPSKCQLMKASLTYPRSSSRQSQILYARRSSSSQQEVGGGKVDDVKRKLLDIEKEAQSLTGTSINLNSPKQVGNALYRNTQRENGGTSKAVLEDMVKRNANTDEEKRQRYLAALILQYRKLKSSHKSLKHPSFNGNVTGIQSASIESFSTLSTNSINSASGTINRNTEIPAFDTEDTSGDLKSPMNSSLTRQKPVNSTNTRAFNDVVNDLFSPPKAASKTSKIDRYWLEAMHSLTRPSARSLISQLHPSCPMGYDPTATPSGKKMSLATTAGKKGTLVDFVRKQKEKHPNAVILTRVGDFYESFGIDAVLLVEHCGLNSMAGKARAGCPIQNVQATLDCLTHAGFRVAVYEEANDTGANRVTGKSKLKNRMLAQIVCPANPTYKYDLVLGDAGSTIDALYSTPSARPYVGIVHSASGYTIVEVSTEERSARITECVTAEAVECRLASYPPADPLFYVPSMAEENSGKMQTQNLPFLPSRWEAERDGPVPRMHVQLLPPSVCMPLPKAGISDVERSKRCIVSAVLRSGEINSQENEDTALRHEDFTTLEISNSQELVERRVVSTNPLYLETASQLGLMTDPTIPDLVDYLVPNNAPNPPRDFLRRWLLTPPPPKIASAMSNVVAYLKDDSPAMPSFEIPPIGKVLSLIRAGQASAQIFREVLVSLKSTIGVLEMCRQNEKGREFISSLMEILRYQTGIDASPDDLRNRCLDAIQVIESVVNTSNGLDTGPTSSDQMSSQKFSGDVVPPAFFERNERKWRGRIKPEASNDAYENVAKSALAVVRATAVEFWGAQDAEDVDLSTAKESKNPIVQDQYDNLISLKAIPRWAKNEDNYYHPRDRNGKVMRNRYTTARCQDAISSYVESCEMATEVVGKVLKELSETLGDAGHLPAITQAAHFNLILTTAYQHAVNANRLGWNLAQIKDADGSGIACRFTDLHPYWMDNSVAVLNSFDLDGLFLLTAPNMSGKSTIMRSAAAAALLTTCGFCAPVGPGSAIKRFDSIFVRGASSDVPSENKSAFGAEMGDIAALLRACGDKSLIFVDELGRGTSPEDGASLAGALLEEMASRGMRGFFATHLHSIFDLPLREDAATNIIYKRMDISENDGELDWTYKMEDGVCTDSRALKTAAKFGIPPHIIARAEQLSPYVKSDDDKARSRRNEPTATAHNGCPNPQPNIADNHIKTSLDDVASIVKEMSGNKKTVEIPPKWSTPPPFEGSSVVYVLEVGQSYYVGETDSLSQRIRQHRSKGGDWANSTTIAVQVDKASARNLESRLIQKLAQEGCDLLSVTDGTKINPCLRP